MKAVRVHEFGGPEKLEYDDVADPSPKPGEAIVRIEASGVNFIDVYQRIGLYKNALPLTLGQEAAGVVSAIGDGVTRVKVGDRVAWTSIMGGYAQYGAVP